MRYLNDIDPFFLLQTHELIVTVGQYSYNVLNVESIKRKMHSREFGKNDERAGKSINRPRLRFISRVIGLISRSRYKYKDMKVQ